MDAWRDFAVEGFECSLLGGALLGLGFRTKGFRVWGLEFGFRLWGFRVWSLGLGYRGFRVLAFRVYGYRYRVLVCFTRILSGFRIWGRALRALSFRAWC